MLKDSSSWRSASGYEVVHGCFPRVGKIQLGVFGGSVFIWLIDYTRGIQLCGIIVLLQRVGPTSGDEANNTKTGWELELK